MILNTNDFAQNMIRQLPEFYFAEDLKYDNVLRKYLMSAFVGGADDLLKSINGIRDFSDPLKCPSEDLPALCESWGIQYEPSIPEIYQRKQLSYIGELYKRKGTYSCIEYLVRNVTGCDCDLIYYKDKKTGDRKFNVVLMANSLQDISSGKMDDDRYAIHRILPRFLPFYLVPKVSYSSPRIILELEKRNLGFRVSERTLSDFTYNVKDNLFLNPDFNLGTDFWESSGNSYLGISSIKKREIANCLELKWFDESSYVYQDIDVNYKDAYYTKAYFMCPDEYLDNPPKVTMMLTYYRDDGSVIHSIFNSDVELNIKDRWCYLKRDFYIDDPLCVRVRVSYHCSVLNQVIYFSSPILLRKNRIESLLYTDDISDSVIQLCGSWGNCELDELELSEEGDLELSEIRLVDSTFIQNNSDVSVGYTITVEVLSDVSEIHLHAVDFEDSNNRSIFGVYGNFSIGDIVTFRCTDDTKGVFLSSTADSSKLEDITNQCVVSDSGFFKISPGGTRIYVRTNAEDMRVSAYIKLEI